MSQLLAAGESAPPFHLPDQQGQVHDLERYRGRWVVLYFYPKDDTPGCTMEARAFQHHQQRFTAADAVVLGVSRDSTEKHSRFASRCGLEFSLLSDADGAVTGAYGAKGRLMGTARVTYVIDPQGKIVAVFHFLSPQRHVDEALRLVEVGASRARSDSPQ